MSSDERKCSSEPSVTVMRELIAEKERRHRERSPCRFIIMFHIAVVPKSYQLFQLTPLIRKFRLNSDLNIGSFELFLDCLNFNSLTAENFDRGFLYHLFGFNIVAICSFRNQLNV